jgi:hypothetical protein
MDEKKGTDLRLVREVKVFFKKNKIEYKYFASALLTLL